MRCATTSVSVCGLERVAQRLQARALLLVVLDDAVVHHRDLVRRDVRVRVRLRSRRRGSAQRVCAMPTMPLRPSALPRRSPSRRRGPRGARGGCLPFEHRDAGRVVAAVLEPLQPLGEDGNDVTAGDGTDDSAHARHSLTTRTRASVKQDSPRPGDRGEMKSGGMLLASRRPRAAGEEGDPRPVDHLAPGARGSSGKGRSPGAWNIRQTSWECVRSLEAPRGPAALSCEAWPWIASEQAGCDPSAAPPRRGATATCARDQRRDERHAPELAHQARATRRGTTSNDAASGREASLRRRSQRARCAASARAPRSPANRASCGSQPARFTGAPMRSL